MKGSFFDLISKLNSFIYNVFSSYPDYVGKIVVGIIYSFIFSLIFSIFGKNFFKFLVFFLITLLFMNWLNVVTINYDLIRNFLGLTEEDDLVIFFKDFIASYLYEILSFFVFFLIFNKYLN